ncbi:MAG: hypothetical protein GY765_15720 [bacterium]|nr:hypothetical protein [bacterium]
MFVAGQRPNLIAIVCSEILNHLQDRNTIETADLETALDSRTVLDSFMGWDRLTDNKEENRTDRLLVETTIHLQTFTLPQLTELLQKKGESIDRQQLDRSLRRLELAFVLKREQGTYSFQVPLFKDYLRS